MHDKASKVADGAGEDPTYPRVFNTELATDFYEMYGDEFYFIATGGKAIGGLKFCKDNVWIEGARAQAARQQLLQTSFCTAACAKLEGKWDDFISATELRKPDKQTEKQAAAWEGKMEALQQKRMGALLSHESLLKTMDFKRTNLEIAINAEIMNRKPTDVDDVRFNVQRENHDLLAFQNGVLDMSKMVMREDGTVNWQGAMRDYHRDDHFTDKCRLLFDFTGVDQEHIDRANGIIDQIVPDPTNNAFIRQWHAICFTGHCVRKFLVHTNYEGQNGKSKLAELHMLSLPLYSMMLNTKTLDESSHRTSTSTWRSAFAGRSATSCSRRCPRAACCARRGCACWPRAGT